jgi:hypothetical protein
MMVFEFSLRVVIFALGVAIVVYAVRSAIRVLVVPRSAYDRIANFTFRTIRHIYNFRLRKARSYHDRDRVMATYAPVALMAMPCVWLIVVLIGYQLIYWALGIRGWQAAFTMSGSSLLTLGSAVAQDLIVVCLTFSEAAIGLILVALLIAYLPTMYSAFSRREAAVTMLEVRAGSPPSAVEMILRYHRLHGIDRLSQVWPTWEAWFVDIEESHTSLAALPFFRSPQGHRSWVTAAGAVLDAAAIITSSVDVPRDAQRELCIRAGYLALRYIASFFRVDFDPNPKPTDPISVARSEFNDALDRLAEAGLPLRGDRDEAWRQFAGWRVNYDTVLLALAAITMAPEAPWSSDRSLAWRHRRIAKKAH